MKSKRCTGECKKEYPATLKYFYAGKQCKDGLRPSCKKCCSKAVKKYRQTEKGRTAHNQQQREYRQTGKGKAANKQRQREYRQTDKGKQFGRKFCLKRRYNLTLKQHEQMYVDQNGCCECCGISISYDKIHTDHNHKTGKVRGLLCPKCNIGMEYIDNKIFLQEAIEYLEKYND